ncbi:MAG: hypothetical protein ABUS57_09320 [Pseudomonadota bacterium]
MTAHKRLNAGATRSLLIGFCFCVGAAGATISILAPPPAEAARPEFIKDMCSETSGDSGGLECNSSTDMLVRPKYTDGTCGDWVCCPARGDGTYDCEHGSSPSVPPDDDEIHRARLRSQLGAQATTVAPPPPPPRVTTRRPNATTTRSGN